MVVASVAATFGWFAWRLATGIPFAVVQSETFTLLAVSQWFNVLNCRSETKSALNFDIVRNPWLLGGLLLANVLQFAIIYLAPMTRFHTVPISLTSFFLIGAAASLVLRVEEARKFLARRRIADSNFAT